MLLIVQLHELGRGDVFDRFEESLVVEPVDPFQCCEFDISEASPRSFCDRARVHFSDERHARKEHLGWDVGVIRYLKRIGTSGREVVSDEIPRPFRGLVAVLIEATIDEVLPQWGWWPSFAWAKYADAL